MQLTVIVCGAEIVESIWHLLFSSYHAYEHDFILYIIYMKIDNLCKCVYIIISVLTQLFFLCVYTRCVIIICMDLSYERYVL